MKISEEVYIHGYIDEIRKDTVIIRNEGGYFGTIPSEIKALEQQPSDDVSIEVYKQVTQERDIAIEQLKELGYDFGEKIRTSEDCVSIAELEKWLDLNFSFGGACRKLELFERLEKELPRVTPTFPKGATNGDMIKAMFPSLDVEIEGNYVTCWIDEHKWLSFDYDWWNAPYKRGTENG